MADNPSLAFLWKKNAAHQQPAAAAVGSQFSPTQKEGQTEMCVPLTQQKMKSFEMEEASI